MPTSYSMPWGFSLYGTPPYPYSGNRIASVVFETDPAALRRLVPEPLVPNPEHLTRFWIGKLHLARGYSYLESGLMVPVRLGERQGEYVVCLYLDTGGNPTLILGGRELWGTPKVDAQITWVEEADRIHATVARAGTRLAELDLALTQHQAPVPVAPAPPWICLKLIPSVREDQVPDVMQLTSLPFPSQIETYATGTATLALSAPVETPLGGVPVRTLVQSSFEVSDVVLGYGEVLFDYLAQQESVR